VDDAGAAQCLLMTSLQETEEALQCIISTCYAWCTRWMAANIGPTQSAVVVFALQLAAQPDHSGLRWGEAPLPTTDAYRHLGVELHEDCTWHAHIQHAAAKGRGAAGWWWQQHDVLLGVGCSWACHACWWGSAG
jgi:hypothetical protein